MAYYLQQFGSQALPPGDPLDSLGSGPFARGFADVAGGSFDRLGAVPQSLGRHEISHRGIVSANVAATVDALLGLQGTKDYLYRLRQSDNSQQRKLARLQEVVWDRGVGQRDHSILRLIFEAAGPWQAASQTTTTSSGSDFSPNNLGNASDFGPLIEWYALAGGSHTVQIQQTTLGIDWTWSGTMSSGDKLSIDCGNFTANLIDNSNVSPAYDGLTFNADHTSSYWCYLPAGSTEFTLSVSGYSGNLSFKHYDSWL